MKLLLDAQIPRNLCRLLASLGHDCVHTLDLPRGNRSTDKEIADIAKVEDRIVVTKDSDFVDSHVINGLPAKLLLISTGNVPNRELAELVQANLATIDENFERADFLELARDRLIIH